MEWLINALVKALGSYLSLWLEKKKAERLEVKIKKIEIADKVKEVEEKIKEVSVQRAKDRHLNPAMWNQNNRLKSQSICASRLVILLVIFISGCWEVKYIEGKWPKINVPPRPVISETPAFSEREKTIVGYTMGLEAAIETYNEEADAHNKEHGYDD